MIAFQGKWISWALLRTTWFVFAKHILMHFLTVLLVYVSNFTKYGFAWCMFYRNRMVQSGNDYSIRYSKRCLIQNIYYIFSLANNKNELSFCLFTNQIRGGLWRNISFMSERSAILIYPFALVLCAHFPKASLHLQVKWVTEYLYDKCKIVDLILYLVENFSFIQHNNILQEEVLKAKVSNIPDCFMISIHVLA